jgi:hypothetical protein
VAFSANAFWSDAGLECSCGKYKRIKHRE